VSRTLAARRSAGVIRTLGVDVTVRRIARVVDPATGKTTDTVTDTEAKGVIQEYAARFVDGTVVRRGDRRLTIAAADLALTPVPGNQILIGGDVFEVVNVESKYVGAEVVAYELQIRR
jgi:hypothetical protein